MHSFCKHFKLRNCNTIFEENVYENSHPQTKKTSVTLIVNSTIFLIIGFSYIEVSCNTVLLTLSSQKPQFNLNTNGTLITNTYNTDNFTYKTKLKSDLILCNLVNAYSLF